MRFLAATTVVLALLFADFAAAAWRPPVPGPVTRAFDLGADPFEAGRHRGVDLAAPPGATVRAPCAGAVAFAGSVGTSGRVVTLLCGPWRVTHMPLATIAVRAGSTVAPGAPLGTVAAARDHAGLHLGVRRDGTRFGYADPMRFLGAPDVPAIPPLGRAPRPARPPRSTPPRPHAPRPPAPRSVPAPRPHAPRPPAPRPVPAPRRTVAPPPGEPRPAPAEASNRGLRAPFAPWPAWVGLALVLAGVGLRLRGWPSAARGRVRAAGTLGR
jgi:hypothetical protein